jgi:hypothetical protein
MQKWKFVLAFILVAAFAGNVYFWNYRYTADIQARYDIGFHKGKEIGYVEGNESGYQFGYENGYYNGNSSGYHSGYYLGYKNGNSSGYHLGYNNGNQTGYEYGYTQGYNSGHVSGYQIGYSSGNCSGYQLGYDFGFLDGNQTGFADGYIEGVEDGAGKGYTIRDPTYQEVMDFIALDRTDENEYSEDYTCFHFTADVKDNAFHAGYRCGFVYIEFPDSAHLIVCFSTLNNGLIFIEPQNDYITTLTVGQPYWDRAKYEPPDYDDTVVSFTIIW